MTAFLIGFTLMVGPALAWHLHVVARRWPNNLDGGGHPLPVTPVAGTRAKAASRAVAVEHTHREDHRP